MALSNDFIRVFKTKVDWGWIAINKPLCETYIDEFHDFNLLAPEF
jgi:hypothetical protein